MAEKETDKQVEEKFFGLIGTMILDDMSKNSEMLQKLTGQIEYDRGFKEGHLTGYRQAQADIRAAKLELDYAMGLVKFREDM